MTIMRFFDVLIFSLVKWLLKYFAFLYWIVCVLIIECRELIIYFGYKFCIRNAICKYFLPGCYCLFIVFMMTWREVLNFDEVQFINFIFYGSLLNSLLQGFFLLLPSRSFIEDMDQCLFWVWIFNCPSTICWKHNSFCIELLCTFVKNQLIKYVWTYFWTLHSAPLIHLYIFLRLWHILSPVNSRRRLLSECQSISLPLLLYISTGQLSLILF